MIAPRQYLCETCRDTGYEQVVVGKARGGFLVYASSDIACRPCKRAYQRAMRMGRELVEQADRFLDAPKHWR